MVFIKQVNNSDPGNSDFFGGDDFDNFDKYFDNIDLTPKVATIDTLTRFRSSKFIIRNPANSFSHIFVGSATNADRTITWPDATGIVILDSNTATMTNKTFGNTNTFTSESRNFTTDTIVKFQKVEKYGRIINDGLSIVGEGHLNQIQLYGTIDFSDLDSSGYYSRVATPSLAGGFAGLAQFQTIPLGFRRSLNPLIIFKYQLNSADYPLADERFYFGVWSQQALLPNSDTPLGSTDSGALFAFRVGVDTNYQIIVNDGTGAAPTPTDTGQAFPTSSTPHELELKLHSTSGVIWTIRNDAGTQLATGTITTRIPATSTRLYLVAGVQAKTTTAKKIIVRNMECKTGGS